jgi:hypothetical protein
VSRFLGFHHWDPISLAGSSTVLACQPASIVPSGFEPHLAPMLVPLPAPRVPPGFPPRAALTPSAPRIITTGGPTGCQGSLPLYRGWRSDCPLYRGWRSDRPLWRSNHLGALRRASCFARRGSTIARLADITDRLHPSSTTTCDTVARNSTPPKHDYTCDTVGEPSPDGHTGQRRFSATL